MPGQLCTYQGGWKNLFEVRIEQTLEGLKSVVFLSTARKGSPDKEKFQTEFPVWDPTYCSWNLQEASAAGAELAGRHSVVMSLQ